MNEQIKAILDEAKVAHPEIIDNIFCIYPCGLFNYNLGIESIIDLVIVTFPADTLELMAVPKSALYTTSRLDTYEIMPYQVWVTNMLNYQNWDCFEWISSPYFYCFDKDFIFIGESRTILYKGLRLSKILKLLSETIEMYLKSKSKYIQLRGFRLLDFFDVLYENCYRNNELNNCDFCRESLIHFFETGEVDENLMERGEGKKHPEIIKEIESEEMVSFDIGLIHHFATIWEKKIYQLSKKEN